VKDGDKVLIRGKGNNENEDNTEYWPAIIQHLDESTTTVIWLEKTKKTGTTYKLGKSDTIDSTAIIGPLSGITSSGSGKNIKFLFSEATQQEVEQMKSAD